MKIYPHEIHDRRPLKAAFIVRIASVKAPGEELEWTSCPAHSETEAERIRQGAALAAAAFGQTYHYELFRSEIPTCQVFTARKTLEHLISWLEDNVDQGTEIIFDNESADSEAMLPGLRELLRIL